MKLLPLLCGESAPVDDLNIVLGELLGNLAGEQLGVTRLEFAGAIGNLLQDLLRAQT